MFIFFVPPVFPRNASGTFECCCCGFWCSMTVVFVRSMFMFINAAFGFTMGSIVLVVTAFCQALRGVAGFIEWVCVSIGYTHTLLLINHHVQHWCKRFIIRVLWKTAVKHLSSIFMGFSLINHPFWVPPIYGTPHIFQTYSNCTLRKSGKNMACWKPIPHLYQDDFPSGKKLVLVGRCPNVRHVWGHHNSISHHSWITRSPWLYNYH